MNLRTWLPTLAYERPVTVTMLFVALLVVGLIAYARIPLQMLPSGMEARSLFVWIPYPDASPLETDAAIVGPVEDELATVPGLEEVHSRASAGEATFRLRFWGHTDMDEAYDDVVDRLERALVRLPADVQRYLVFRFDPDASPIMWVGVTLPDTVEHPHHLLSRVVAPRIERIPGVADARVFGVPKEVVAIEYDRDALYAHGVDLGELHRRLQRGDVQHGSGRSVERGQVRPLRALAPLTPGDLGRFPVTRGLVLGDIASIRRGALRSSDIWRVNGERAAVLSIRKESGANTREVGERVVAALEALEREPRVEGARFHVFFNQGELIEESVSTLTQTTLVGGLFAVAVLWAFLREWRTTLLIAASCLLFTVGGLYALGMDLNLVSLMGLMLAVGMVVDNAIVVVETIHRRRAAGEPPRRAAIEGTAEVNLAIVASTATTMVVFLPVMLMSENATFAFFLRVMGTPVVLALAASLLVALVFAPLATRALGPTRPRPEPRWLRWLRSGYRRLLVASLRRRSDTGMALLGAVLLTLLVSVPGVRCSESSENINDFRVRFTVPPQASAAERDRIVRAFEEVLDAKRDAWGIRAYSADLEGDAVRGQLRVFLRRDGPLTRERVMAELRRVLPELPGVQAQVGWSGGERDEQRLTLRVFGEDMGMLVELGEEVVRRLEQVEGVLGAQLQFDRAGADEIRLVLRQEALDHYGIEADRVGRTVAFALRTNTLPPLRDGERGIELRSSFAPEDRDSIDTVLSFQIWSPARGHTVPLRALADVEIGRGPLQIERWNRRTAVEVQVDLEESKDVVWPRIAAALDDLAFPEGMGWSRDDPRTRRQEEDAAMLFALAMSAIFVFLLMGMLFESALLPLGILSTVPMAMAGSTWGLYLTDTPLDFMAGVGLVILVGVVVNNGIVLVDLVEQLRSEGMERTEALVEAGARRFRPIVMTALTTICGLVPTAVGGSNFIGIPYAPLGRTVIGGLAVGTALTLVFVPFVYVWIDDHTRALLRWWRQLSPVVRVEP